MPDHAQSVFELFPAVLVAIVMVVEVLISFFFVAAWLYSLALARQGRRDGLEMKKEIKRLVDVFTAPSAAAFDGGAQDGLPQSEIDRRLEEGRARRGRRRGPGPAGPFHADRFFVGDAVTWYEGGQLYTGKVREITDENLLDRTLHVQLADGAIHQVPMSDPYLSKGKPGEDPDDG